MSWKPLPETRAQLGQRDQDRLRDLFAVRVFFRFALLPNGFEPTDDFLAALVLTPDAESFLTSDPALADAFPDAVLRLAMFLSFYHHDLFVDETRTDIDTLASTFGRYVRENRVLLPYRFGRLLYDRFNDTVPAGRTEYLEYEEALALLHGTPQGVYQVGRYVCGPLGLVSSAELRYYPPSARLPLWHCSDTGCGALHQVTLRSGPSGVALALRRLESLLNERLGPASEWFAPLRDLCRHPTQGGKRRFYDMPGVLAEALVEEEREVLLTALISSPASPALRAVLSSSIGASAAKGSPLDVVRRLPDASRIHLLLTIDNRELVRMIDRQVASGGVVIPLYETRSAKLLPPHASGTDIATDIAIFGVRSRHPRPLLQLTAAIWEAYSSTNSLDELGWRIRKRTAKPPRGVLSEYMQRVTPTDALRELVLSSMPIALRFATQFLIELQPETEPQLLIDRLLWKLGFDPPRHEHEYQEMRDRLQQFSEALLRVGSIKSERDRESIRSVGVNLFVSVEHFVEQLLSYNIWVLSSDHFLNSFAYERSSALASVARVLDSVISSGDAEVKWDSAGGNTLGTLMTYLHKAVTWVTGLSVADRSAVRRSPDDFPHFADAPETVFRFQHTELWADSEADAISEYAATFGAIAGQLSRADIAAIRNGLDHKRPPEDFPTVNAMLVCVARLRDALDMADAQKFIPKTFWLRNRTADVFGRTEYRLEDYAGRSVSIFGPSMVAPLATLNFTAPTILAPGDLLSDVGADLRFTVTEMSAHTRYWANYPRRRKIPPPRTIPLDTESKQGGSLDASSA